MTRRILVVGGLAAGPSAASKAARTNSDAEVILFEQGEHISYGICEIPYYVSGEVAESDLVVFTPEQLRSERRVEVRTFHRVEEILPTKKRIVIRDLRDGRKVEEPYDRLILATGSSPKTLGVEGETARNIFKIKKLDEAHGLYRYIESEKPTRAVIVGGGYIGMEMSDALRRRAMDVTVLHQHDLPMGLYERETRELVRRELEKNEVMFVARARTKGFVVGKNKAVTHVVTSDGSYETDIVVLALGVTPNSELAKEAGVRVGMTGGIITDQRQQTNLDNIFAAGDCCEVRNIVTNRSGYIPLATIASKQGWVAGENAAGGNAAFRGAIRSTAIRIFGKEVAQVGVSSEEAKEAGIEPLVETITARSKVSMMPGSTRLQITLIVDRRTGRILGGNLIGEDGAVLRAHALAVAIQHKLTVDEMREWDLPYSPPFSPLWDPLLVAAHAAKRNL